LFYAKYLKRPLDLILSGLGLILLSPLFAVLALWIKLDSKGPVFFRQERVGKGKQLFSIYKFRTMRIETPSDMPTHILKNPTKFITRSGGLLRRTSLDELPQLVNIFRGDMSVIGPRPALWNQDDLIAERDKYKGIGGWTPNDLSPGLTGWAQINGRDELEIPVKAKLDGEYVEKMSFSFDANCFFATIVSIFRHEGVLEGGTEARKGEASQERDKQS